MIRKVFAAVKKESVVALVLLLLIPVVLRLEGLLSGLINPEIAAGDPDYARNYHLLNSLKISIFFASLACVLVLFLLGCLMEIRSRKRSHLWLLLALLGPLGFAVLATLDDRAPAQADRYTPWVRKLKWFVRWGYELCVFVAVWELAYGAMVAKQMLSIGLEAIATGVSTAQVVEVQNASSGMWAFAEGNEVMYFVVLLYLLRPIVFNVAVQAAEKMKRAGT